MNGKFSANIAKWVGDAQDQTKELHKAIILELFTSVILDTPVLEGRLRGNWIISSDSPATGQFDVVDPDGTQVELINGGGVSVTQAIGDLDTVKANQSDLDLTNAQVLNNATAIDGLITSYTNEQTLTAATNTTYDLSLGINAKFTPTADAQTIDLPTNYFSGAAGALTITAQSGFSVNISEIDGWYVATQNVDDIAAGADGDKWVLAWYAISSSLYTATLTPAQA